MKKHQGWTVPFLMPNKEEITASPRLSRDGLGGLRELTQVLHPSYTNLEEADYSWNGLSHGCEVDAKYSGFYASPTGFEQIRAAPPAPRAKSVPESCCSATKLGPSATHSQILSLTQEHFLQ